MNRTRYYSSILMLFIIVCSLHGICLSCACLSIGEDSAIVSFKNTFDDGKCSFLKNGFLLTCHSKSSIKSKISWWRKITFLRMRVLNWNFTIRLIHMDDQFMSSLFLFLVWRPASHHDLHCFSFRSNFWWHNLNKITIYLF